MRLKKVNVESYGNFSGKAFDLSDRNLYLFYGKNENGKSTLLSFIRSVLFGYSPRSGETKLFSGRSAVASGEIVFRLSDGRDGFVRRSWRVSDATSPEFDAKLDGAEIDEQELFDALGCSDRDFFSNFFGISYADQATRESQLRPENLSRVIYGLSIGDSERFERVRKLLNSRKEKIFKTSGKNQKLNAAFDEFTRAKEAARVVVSSKEYKRLTAESEELTARQASLSSEIGSLERQLVYWSALDGASEKYRKYRDAEENIDNFLARTSFEKARLDAFTGTLDENYRAKEDEKRNLERNLYNLKVELDRLEVDKRELARKLNPKFANFSLKIIDICDRSAKFEDGRDGLRRKEDELQSREDELVRELGENGAVLDEEEGTAVLDKYCSKIENSLVSEADAKNQEELDYGRIKSQNVGAKLKAETAAVAAEKALKSFQEDLRLRSGLADGAEFADARREFDSVNNAFSGVETRTENARAKLTALQDKLREEANLAKELCDAALGVDDARALGDAEAFLADNGSGIRLEELEQLKEGCGTLSVDIEKLETSTVASEKRLEKLRAEIEEKSGGALGAELPEDEARRAMERRDLLWKRVKSLLFEDARPAGYYRDTSVAADAFEDAVAESDRLNEKRCKFASVSGEVKALRRQHDAASLELQKQEAQLQTARNERAQKESDANELLNRAGLAFCAGWTLERSVAWCGKLREFRALRDGARAERDELGLEVKKIQRDLARVVDLAKKWNVETQAVFVFPLEQLSDFVASLDALEDAKSLLEKIASRVCECDEIRRKIDVEEKTLVDKREEIENANVEIAVCDAALRRLAEERSEFLEKLPFALSDLAGSSWLKIYAALAEIRKWQGKVAEYDRERLAHQKREREYRELDEEVDELSDKLGVSRTSNERLDVDVKAWRKTADEASTNQGIYERVESDCRLKRDKVEAEEKILERVRSELISLEETTGTTGEDFVKFREDAGEWRTLKSALVDAKKLLEAQLHGQNFLECRADLQKYDPVELKNRVGEFSAKKNAGLAENAELSKEMGQIEGELKRLKEQEGRYARNVDYQTALAELRVCVDEYAPIQLALSHLEDSLKNFEEKRMPRILDAAGDYLSRFTNGRFVGIERADGKGGKKSSKKTDSDERLFNDGETAGYRAKLQGGDFLGSGMLSQGTLEQLLFAVRLALVDEYCETSESLPLVLDDVLVQFDDERSRNVLGALRDLAEDETRQIVVMTHHERTRELFREVAGDGGIINL